MEDLFKEDAPDLETVAQRLQNVSRGGVFKFTALEMVPERLSLHAALGLGLGASPY